MHGGRQLGGWNDKRCDPPLQGKMIVAWPRSSENNSLEKMPPAGPAIGTCWAARWLSSASAPWYQDNASAMSTTSLTMAAGAAWTRRCSMGAMGAGGDRDRLRPQCLAMSRPPTLDAVGRLAGRHPGRVFLLGQKHFEGFGPRRLAITERQPDPCRHIVIGHKESIFAAAEFPRESLSGFFESHQVLALARRAAHPKHQPEVPLPQPVRQRPLHRRSAGLVFRQHRPDTGGAKQRRSCFGPPESSSPWTADWRVRRCSRRSRPPTGPAASPVAGES